MGKDGGPIRCNYTLDAKALRRLDKLATARREAGVLSQVHCTKSGVVRDAISMLYEYEVLHESHLNPFDMGPEEMRRDGIGRKGKEKRY